MAAQANWQSTNIATDNLINFEIGEKLLANDMWANKLSGYRYIRGTAVIKVVMNMSPYQQGSLLVYHYPCPGGTDFMVLNRRETVLGASQLPGIRMANCNRETEVRIPYVGPLMHFDMLEEAALNFGWARFCVDVLTPLETGSGGQLSTLITVFLSFEDVELEAPIFPQSSGGSIPFKKIRRKNVTEAEGAKMSSGPVSKALAAGKDLSTYAKGIPLLSSIAEPAWWFFGLGEKVAGLFGWSRPLDETGISRIVKNPNFNSVNADGKDISQPMSLLSCNKVETITNIPGHDMDEMSINFIKSQWSIIDTVTWTTNATSTLSYYNLNPDSCFKTVSFPDGPTTRYAKQHSSISFLASMFRQYRGSMRVRLRFIKTQFHAGTLAVALYPVEGSAGPPSLSVDTLQYLHAEYIDISEVDVVDLVVPYANAKNYLDATQAYCTLYLHVLNQLKCPQTVAQQIQIVVEVSGAEDLEFAAPKNYYFPPVMTCQSGGFIPQAGGKIEEKNEECEELETYIGNSDIVISDSYASYCVGERVMSVLQLLKPYTRLYLGTATSFGIRGGFWPHDIGAVTFKQSSSVLYPGIGPTGDAYSTISQCYAFRRGGVRIRFDLNSGNYVRYYSLTNQPRTNGTGGDWFSSTPIGDLSGGAVITASWPIFPTTYAQGQAVDQNASLQIPYYSNYPLAVNTPLMYHPENSSSFNFYPWGSPTSFLSFDVPDGVSPSGEATISRAVADDFQLAYWIGAPILWY